MTGKTFGRFSLSLSLGLFAASIAAAETPLGTSFTYQGQLKLGGSPLNDTADFEFALWDADTLGDPVGSTVAVNNVTVVDGLFTVELDFGVSAFVGKARWLEIAVRSPAGGGAFATLAPRQRLTAAPIALTLPALKNIDRDEAFAVGSWNIVGGARFNTVEPLAAGVTICGGGRQAGANVAFDNFTVIGGGDGNVVGTDDGDPNDAAYASIGGGSFNIASGNYSTVAGGVGNQATGIYAFIGGGEDNVASGVDGTVPGGQQNAAAGDYSFAAGRRAKANHDGSFVWGDSTNANFSSTGNNQFLIRAGGGVGIGTATPGTALDVVGTVRATAFVGDGSGLTNIQGSWTPNGADISFTSGNVGIGTTTPRSSLDVAGDVAADSVITPSVLSNDGTGLQLQSINLTLDQSFESTCCYGTPNDVWQSFTAGVTGDLGAVELHRFEGAATGIVQIYAGEGTGGALLASTSIPATGVYVWQRATMPAAVSVVSGNVYTIRVSASGANNWVYQNEGSDYPGGRWSLGTIGDFGFRTHVVAGSPMATIHDKGLGIGRVAATNALEVEGNASKSAAGSWLANSDRRIKTDIKTVAHALDTLDKIRLVSFEYTKDYQRSHAGVGKGRYLNVIAQEFAEVFPDNVKGSGEFLPDGSEILQVDTYPLTIYSAAAIRELHQQLKNKELQFEALQRQNDELARRLARIEAMLQRDSHK